MKIYILLTSTNTLPSRMIRLFSSLKYTHISISLDNETFYSFSRKYTYFILPGGFIEENIGKGVLKRFEKSKCMLFSMEVTLSQYKELESIIEKMKNNNKYHYNILGLMLCRLGIPYERKNHMFCSEFVAYAMSSAKIIDLKKSKSLYTPKDFPYEKMEVLYSGKIKDLNKKEG